MPYKHALDQLKRAKGLSDQRNYGQKNQVLRQLIQKHPDDFIIDSQEGDIIGITHRPTKFRIHMQRSSFPTAHTIMKTAKVELDLEVGDVILTGRFKNKRTVVEELGTDSLGQPTVNGMKLLSLRLEKTMPPGRRSKETQEMNKQAYLAGYMHKEAQDKMPSLPSMDVGKAVDYGRQAWGRLLKGLDITGDPRNNIETRRIEELADYDRQALEMEQARQRPTDPAADADVFDYDDRTQWRNPPQAKPAGAPWWLKQLSGINPELIDDRTGWSSQVDPKTNQRSYKQTSPEKSQAYEKWLQATPELEKNPSGFEDHWTKRMEDTNE